MKWSNLLFKQSNWPFSMVIQVNGLKMSGESFWLSNYGYDAYEINEVLFLFKQKWSMKGKYENNYHSYNDIYTGKFYTKMANCQDR